MRDYKDGCFSEFVPVVFMEMWHSYIDDVKQILFKYILVDLKDNHESFINSLN